METILVTKDSASTDSLIPHASPTAAASFTRGTLLGLHKSVYKAAVYAVYPYTVYLGVYAYIRAYIRIRGVYGAYNVLTAYPGS
jgi:hypothetical protein